MKHATFTTVRSARRLTEMDFAGWVGAAAPGDRLEYHRGFLAVDIVADDLEAAGARARRAEAARRPRLVGRRAAPRAPRAGAARPRPLRLHRHRPAEAEARRGLARGAARRRRSRPDHPILHPTRSPECRFRRTVPVCRTCPTCRPQEIAALPADVLAVLQQESEAALKQAKAAKSRLDGALVLKYGARAADGPPRRGQGHRHGPLRRWRHHRDRRPAEAGGLGPGAARRDGRAHPRRRRRPGRVRRDQLQGRRAQVRRLARGDPGGVRAGAHRAARQADDPAGWLEEAR